MEFSRRDMLVGLLGLPVVANCRRQSTAIRWEGGFIETGAAHGHKLRDGFRPLVKSEVEIPCLILGGGISGLAAGWQLSRLGFKDFKILELGTKPGGTALGGRMGDLQYPWGAHYLPTPHREHYPILELLEETGSLVRRDATGLPVYKETHLCADPDERVFFAGTWHEGLFPTLGASRDDLSQYRNFLDQIQAFAKWRDADGRKAFALPMADSGFSDELKLLDEMSILEWMNRKKMDSERLKWWVDYGCRDDFGGELSTTSAWAAFHYFVCRIPEQNAKPSEYLTWPQGNQFLVDHMIERIGSSRLELETLILSVQPHQDGRRAKVVVWDTQTEQATAYITPKVIYALPSFTRKYVIKGFEKLPAYHPEYVPWMVANLHLSDTPDSHGFPLAWDNVIYGSRSLGYVVSTHQIPRHRGKTVWTYYLPLSGPNARASRQQLYSLDYKQACDAIMTELTRCHIDFAKHVKRIDIMRWGHAMTRPKPGDIWSPERKRAALPVGPLHFAHTDLSAFALFEESFSHGTRAAKEVHRGVNR